MKGINNSFLLFACLVITAVMVGSFAFLHTEIDYLESFDVHEPSKNYNSPVADNSEVFASTIDKANADFSLSYFLPYSYAQQKTLFVSAEKLAEGREYFAGPMVVEIVVRDPKISEIDEGVGEPTVTVNGNTVRMVQASDGSWYAYIADKKHALRADSLVGQAGLGLDFGEFCNNDSDIAGISFSDTVGFAVARDISDGSNGGAGLGQCSGSPPNGIKSSDTLINNVVRQPKSVNLASPSSGQVGIDPDAWPVVQLFDFSDGGNVVIKYQKAGGTEQTNLVYDNLSDFPSLSLDRDSYPRGAEVFVTINDYQLNIDPTDEDSWTFGTQSGSTFYRLFDDSGRVEADGTAGAVDVSSSLDSLMFEDNGQLVLDRSAQGSSDVVELKDNSKQDLDSNGNTQSANAAMTFVETRRNSGVFVNYDESNVSNLATKSDSQRGTSATIEYNKKSHSILVSTFSGSVAIGEDDVRLTVGSKSGAGGDRISYIEGGRKIKVTLVDPDQNINTGARDDLDVFRSSATIPSIQIGNPVTLEGASSVRFRDGNDATVATASSSVPDKSSDILVIDTSSIGQTNARKVFLNLGITVSDLRSLFVNPNRDDIVSSTNWINFDLRSFQRQLEVDNFSGMNMTLEFGSNEVTILDTGDASSAQELVRIDDNSVSDVFTKGSGSSQVSLEIDFGDPNSISLPSTQSGSPIVFDLFSFAVLGDASGDQSINNAIYRLELEEESSNSSTFKGTMEFFIVNQLGLFDASFVQNNLVPIGDEVRVVVHDELADEDGVNIAYSDITSVGVREQTSQKRDVKTQSGKVSLEGSHTPLRMGRPVVITLKDSDLNRDSDTIDIYKTVDDPNSSAVDTVGNGNGEIMLEVKLKGHRFQRCTVDGVRHGGLAATGFSLVETGPETGVFQGTFRMPTRICSEDGTGLISPAGGDLEVKYHDFRDEFGQKNIFTLDSSAHSYSSSTDTSSKASASGLVEVDKKTVSRPKHGSTEYVRMSGSVGKDYNSGVPIHVIIVKPDGTKETLQVYGSARSNGQFDVTYRLDSDSKIGQYDVFVVYRNSVVTDSGFEVIGSPRQDTESSMTRNDDIKIDAEERQLPPWVKQMSRNWEEGGISDSEFLHGIRYLAQQGFTDSKEGSKKVDKLGQEPRASLPKNKVPHWIKNNVKWWLEGSISQNEFLQTLGYLIDKKVIRIG